MDNIYIIKGYLLKIFGFVLLIFFKELILKKRFLRDIKNEI